MTESHLARAEELAQGCEAEVRAFLLALVGEVRRLRAGEEEPCH